MTMNPAIRCSNYRAAALACWLLLGFMLLGIGSALAANKTFTGTGNFSTGGNWNGGTVPAAGDNLTIRGNCTFDNAAANLAYGTLVLGGGPTAGVLSWPVGGTNTLNVTAVSAAVAGSSINMTNGGTLQVRTSWSITNMAFTPGAGTINWNVTGAASTLPATIATYNNLTVTATGRIASLGTATTVNGNLLISAGTLSVGAGNLALDVKGNFTNNAAFTQGTGTVTISGTAAQAIQGSATTTFNNLTVTNTSAPVSLTPTTNITNVSGTLNMNGANTVLTPGAAVVLNSAAAAGTLTGTGTVHVTRTAAVADYSSQYRFTTNTLANLTVDYSGAGNQTVNNLAYGNLKLSGSGTKTMPGAALTTTRNFIMAGSAQATAAGAMTVGGNFDMSAVGNTATFNGATFTHNVAGNFTKAATSTFTPATSTFNFNGTALQTITGNVTFNHLTVSNATVGNSVSIANDVTVNGNVSHAGTPIIGSGKIVLAGGGAVHQLSGSGTYQNLQLNDTQGALLTASPTVSGTLTLTNGLVTTGSINTLIIGASASISGASTTSHVVGNLAKTFNAAGAFTYAVGDGTRYAPVDITFTALPTPGRMTVSATAGDHPDSISESSSIDPTKSVNRYWTLKNTTLVGTFNATFNYLAADLDGGTTAASMVIARGATCAGSGLGRSCSNTWSRPALGGAPSTTQATATGMDTGVTESDFAIGELVPVRFSREKEFIFTRELYP
jgi:hypothetical protein